MRARDYQTRAVNAIGSCLAECGSTLLVLPTGCHAKGQGILKFDGTIAPVESIRVGDWLMGPDSYPRRVLALARGHGILYRIDPVKGDPFIVNEDHVLTLIRTNEKADQQYPSYRRGGEIVDVTVREWLQWSKWKRHIHKLFRVGVEFPSKLRSPVPSYFVGVLLGDGCTRHYSVSITTADSEIVAECSRIASLFGLQIRIDRQPNNAASAIYITRGKGKGFKRTSHFADELRELGIYGVRCESKVIPPQIKCGSAYDRAEVLAGLIDTDGHATCGGFDYISKSPQLSSDVAFVARSLGLAAYVSTCQKRDQNGKGGTYHRVSISGECSKIPCRIARKRIGDRRQKKSVLRTGFTAKRLGEGDFYGFSLDGDGRFLLDDFTVTHNTGKTVVLAHAIGEHCPPGKRALVLAHRFELIEQNARTIGRVLGEPCDIECGDVRADDGSMFRGKARVIVASKDSLHRKRLERFDAREFGMIITDEAHHATAGSYKRVYDHFANVPHLGVTATPDRLDKQALGQIYKSVAMTYEIADAIRDGWLVPVKAHTILVSDLNLANIGTVGADLNQGQLAEQLERERVMHEIAASITREAGDRRALVFTVSVRQAEKLAGILSDYRANCARFVCGETPDDERAALFAAHKAGEYQYLVNVGVATEGYDDPGVSLIVMARPTKSRALFAQCLGRGTRPLAGTVDGLDFAPLRRGSIANSRKPDCMVLDFSGNCGRHKLVTPADVLGGKYPDDDIAAASAALANGHAVDVVEALERARQKRIEKSSKPERDAYDASRSRIVAVAKYLLSPADLFDGDFSPGRERVWEVGSRPTEKQIETLGRHGFQPGDILRMSKHECSRLIGTIAMRVVKGLCTVKQARALERRGVANAASLTFKEASRMLDEMYGARV